MFEEDASPRVDLEGVVADGDDEGLLELVLDDGTALQQVLSLCTEQRALVGEHDGERDRCRQQQVGLDGFAEAHAEPATAAAAASVQQTLQKRGGNAVTHADQRVGHVDAAAPLTVALDTSGSRTYTHIHYTHLPPLGFKKPGLQLAADEKTHAFK